MSSLYKGLLQRHLKYKLLFYKNQLIEREGYTLLIQEGELYIDRHSVGQFKVYLAMEDAVSLSSLVKAVDLTRDANIYLSSETVVPFEGKLDEELIEVAEKYNYI